MLAMSIVLLLGIAMRDLCIAFILPALKALGYIHNKCSTKLSTLRARSSAHLHVRASQLEACGHRFAPMWGGRGKFKAEQETPRNPSVRLAAQLDSESRGSSQVVIPYFND